MTRRPRIGRSLAHTSLHLTIGTLALASSGCGDDPSRWNELRGVWMIESYVRTAADTGCDGATDDVLAEIEETFVVSEALVGGVNTDLWVRSCTDVETCRAMAESLRGGRPPDVTSSFATVARHVDPVQEVTIDLEGCTVTSPSNLVFVEHTSNTFTVTERVVEDFELEAEECTDAGARAALPEQCAYEEILTARLATSLPPL